MSMFFFAEVVKSTGTANQHDYAGDVQIRVDGTQSDKGGLPDTNLRWARCVYPAIFPQAKGMGFGGCGLIPGSRVYGFYADANRQIPYILGSINASVGKYGSVKYQDSTTSLVTGLDHQYEGVDGATKYIRDEDRGSRFVDGTSGKDFYESSGDETTRKRRHNEEQETHEKYAETKGGGGNAKYPKNPHMGKNGSDTAAPPDIIKFLKNAIDPNNINGFKSTYPVLEALKRRPVDSVGGLAGLGGIGDIIGSFGFNQMNILSSIIGVDISNFAGSLLGMINGMGGLDALGLLSSIGPGFLSSLDLGPMQGILGNVLQNTISSNFNIQGLLGNLNGIIGSDLASFTGILSETQIGQIVQQISPIVNLPSGVNLGNILHGSSLINQLSMRSDEGNFYSLPIGSNDRNNLISEFTQIANQISSLLNIGDLTLFVNDPHTLISEVSSRINYIIDNGVNANL